MSIMKYICYLIIALFLLNANKGYSQDLSGVTILVNPGHGGFDSDDRNIPFGKFKPGDQNGFGSLRVTLIKEYSCVSFLKMRELLW